MGNIIVTEFLSLDGVFEDPGGSESYKYGGWTFKFDRGEDGNKFKLDETMETDISLLGRITYQGFSKAWPSRTGDFADKFNNMPKYVVSTQMKKADLTWNNSHLINKNIIDEISSLKESTEGNIVVSGSGKLVNLLLENDLADQINLMVFPTILGSGKKLFNNLDHQLNFDLIQSFPVGKDGIIVLKYKYKTH